MRKYLQLSIRAVGIKIHALTGSFAIGKFARMVSSASLPQVTNVGSQATLSMPSTTAFGRSEMDDDAKDRCDFACAYDHLWPVQRRTAETPKPGLCAPMYPYVAVRGPTYRENSHANHTWNPQLHRTACFKASEATSVWVRFPSPAPKPQKRKRHKIT